MSDHLTGRIIGLRYRWWSRLLHRYGYHHTRMLYPQDENGHVTAVLKCDWCGLNAKKPPTVEQTIADMTAHVGTRRSVI